MEADAQPAVTQAFLRGLQAGATLHSLLLALDGPRREHWGADGAGGSHGNTRVRGCLLS